MLDSRDQVCAKAPAAPADTLVNLVIGIRQALVHPDLGVAAKLSEIRAMVDEAAPTACSPRPASGPAD
jgi:hypothetical protein